MDFEQFASILSAFACLKIKQESKGEEGEKIRISSVPTESKTRTIKS